MVPGMEQRIDVPSAPLVGHTMVRPERLGSLITAFIRDRYPFAIDADTVVTVLRIPIRVRQRDAIGA